MTLPTFDMPTALVAVTALDLAAIAALAWFTRRATRGRDSALEEQRQALESLRTDLAELVADAEARAARLDETLGAREQSLRALLGKLDRTPEPRQPAPSRPAATTGSGLVERAGVPELARRLGRGKKAVATNGEAAEARLLRDLELSLGGGA